MNNLYHEAIYQIKLFFRSNRDFHKILKFQNLNIEHSILNKNLLKEKWLCLLRWYQKFELQNVLWNKNDVIIMQPKERIWKIIFQMSIPIQCSHMHTLE